MIAVPLRDVPLLSLSVLIPILDPPDPVTLMDRGPLLVFVCFQAIIALGRYVAEVVFVISRLAVTTITVPD